MQMLKNPIIVLALMGLVGWISFLIGTSTKPAVEFVNVKQVVSESVVWASKNLSKSQQSNFIESYNKALPKTLEQYATEHHVSLVTATTLYDNSGVDVTQAIIAANLRRIHHA